MLFIIWTKISYLRLAFDNEILTFLYKGSKVHATYESISLAQQQTLRNGLKTLIGIGLSKSESQVSPYSGGSINQWITEADFKNIFPDTLKFTFRYEGNPYSLSLYQIWDLLFLGGQFDLKLFNLNERIQFFKDAEAGGSPYLAVINNLYPIASERFLELAESFATLLMNLHDNRLFTGPHDIFDILSPDQIILLRLIFGL